jgi:hypothetical protein
MNKKFWIKKIIGFTIMAVAFVAFISYVVMRLWNGVLVDVTTVKEITYPQAIGILVLAKILFGGFKGNCWCGKGNSWKQNMKEKWEKMNPEEREKFKQEWRNKCKTWGKLSSND